MLSQGHRTHTTLWEHSYTSGTLLGPNWLRGPRPFLLYKVLYSVHASPRGPCVAIQLYSAIHYTAIHRYTLYRLYNTPLPTTRPPWPLRPDLSSQRWRPHARPVLPLFRLYNIIRGKTGYTHSLSPSRPPNNTLVGASWDVVAGVQASKGS